VFFDGYRADLNEFMVVVMVPPIPPFTVPVTVVVLMPVRVVPIMIPTIFIGPCNQRGTDYGTKDCEGQK
jgi:hypothetical protein